MTCKFCKEKKAESEFAIVEGYRRSRCKACTKKNAAYYTHPESFYNLFIGRESWRHIYFSKTIVSRKSF
jgi:hypothetical protein